MQEFIYVRRSTGISKKNKPYDMTEVSDGVTAFILNNASGVGDRIDALGLERGDSFNADVHVTSSYGSLRGEIVDIED